MRKKLQNSKGYAKSPEFCQHWGLLSPSLQLEVNKIPSSLDYKKNCTHRECSSTLYVQGGNFHLKVGGAKSSGNAGDPMLGDLKKIRS